MKISVIVPAYNAQKTISRCIEALVTQTCRAESYEITVVDDGSIDGTADIIKKYPVRYIYQKNHGPAAARNAGVYESEGEIILFTDSDCIPSNNWIEEMIKPFSDAEVVAVKGAYITKQRELVARFAQVEFLERFNLLEKADRIDMVDTYSAAFRKEVFLEAGGFDLSFPVANNEDTELSYKLSKMGHKMVFNPDAVVCHLGHPDSLKRYAGLKFWRGYWRMVVYKMHPDKMLKDSYTPQSLKLQGLLFYAFPFSLFSIALFPTFGLTILALNITLFFLSSLSFTLLALKTDIKVGLLAPFLLFVRAASIGSGALWGAVFADAPPKKTKKRNSSSD